MAVTLRIVLLIASLLATGYTIFKIRKSQMLLSGAIFWILLSIGLIVLGIFPEIAINVSRHLGVESPANFVFLVVLAIVLVKLFLLSIDVSVLKTKLKLLAEEYAILINSGSQPHVDKQRNEPEDQ